MKIQILQFGQVERKAVRGYWLKFSSFSCIRTLIKESFLVNKHFPGLITADTGIYSENFVVKERLDIFTYSMAYYNMPLCHRK